MLASELALMGNILYAGAVGHIAIGLFAIVIDVGVLALALAVRVFRAYKTLDVRKLGERLAQDSEEEVWAFPAVGVQPVMRAGPRP